MKLHTVRSKKNIGTFFLYFYIESLKSLFPFMILVVYRNDLVTFYIYLQGGKTFMSTPQLHFLSFSHSDKSQEGLH